MEESLHKIRTWNSNNKRIVIGNFTSRHFSIGLTRQNLNSHPHFGTFASTQTLTKSQPAKEPKFSRHRNLQLDTSPIFATVKLFTFIFSFYILFLSTVPCCEVDNCNDETQQSQTADKHEHSEGCKNCSPFTLCGNCVGFTFIANNLQVDTPHQFTQQTFSGYIQSYLPQYVSSFWQPPRLG